jgi:pimeloyl-ACP methyl ester carboxylesterase
MPTVRAGDADIAYEVMGDGEPLLLIMGLAADSRMWLMQSPVFAQHYRVITFDNRGVGASSAPPGPYTTEQMASDALAVLDAAGVESCHIAGISMGGAIAQHVALKAPERVRSLVLAATWCGRNAYTERMTELGRLLNEHVGQHAVVKASMMWLFTPHFIIERPDFVGLIESMAEQFAPPIEAFEAQVQGCVTHDVCDQLRSLKIPTLVMVGRRDIMVPPELSERIAQAIPGAELRVLETAHAFNVEEADAFNATILEFLSRHRREHEPPLMG